MSAAAPEFTALDLTPWPGLAAARTHSLDLVATLETRLARVLHEQPAVLCVAAAGSLARLEAGPDADLDAIIVTTGPVHDARALADRVYATLDGLPLRAPKAWGIYRDPVDVDALCSPAARGALDEPPALFGKRFQFLLDTRPLYGHAAHTSLQRRILAWYAGDHRTADTQPTLLLHDLQRYQHAYAAWQSWKFDHDDTDGWTLRQAKLGSSRRLGFAALSLLLGASSQRLDKLDWLAAQLPLTPLARVQAVMRAYDPDSFVRYANHYAAVHAMLAAPALRSRLVAQSPRSAHELATRWPEPYAAIAEHNAAMQRVLSAFMLARVSVWHPDYFSSLLL